MNATLFDIVLNLHRRSLDRIFFVHRQTVAFPTTSIVEEMIIDVPIDPMMNIGATVNIHPRIVSVRMISFVLMVDVSKEADVTNISNVLSMKINICVIISVL